MNFDLFKTIRYSAGLLEYTNIPTRENSSAMNQTCNQANCHRNSQSLYCNKKIRVCNDSVQILHAVSHKPIHSITCFTVDKVPCVHIWVGK